jgi:hypothetical protein
MFACVSQREFVDAAAQEDALVAAQAAAAAAREQDPAAPEQGTEGPDAAQVAGPGAALGLPGNGEAPAGEDRGEPYDAPAPPEGGLGLAGHAVAPREAADDARRPASPAVPAGHVDVSQEPETPRKRARLTQSEDSGAETPASPADVHELPDEVLLLAYQEWTSSPDSAGDPAPSM